VNEHAAPQGTIFLIPQPRLSFIVAKRTAPERFSAPDAGVPQYSAKNAEFG